MPFLSFEAKDQSGQLIRGSYEAPSCQALEQILRTRGLTPVSINMLTIGATPAAVPIMRPNTPVSEAVPASQSSKAYLPPSGHPTLNSPVMRSVQKRNFFLRLKSLFHSGFTGDAALGHLQAGTSQRWHQTFETMRVRCAAGESLSSVMKSFPYSFTPDVIGTVEVGEHSGQMPDAMDQVHMTAVRELKFMLPRALTVASLVLFGPICYTGFVLGKALPKVYAMADIPASRSEAVQRIYDQFGLAWGRHLPVLALILTAVVMVGVVLYGLMFRRLRHRLALVVPVVGHRARIEGAQRLSWALKLLMNSEMAPHRAVQIAASSIPNLQLRDQVLKSLEHSNAQEPIDQILKRANLFNSMDLAIVDNGQTTGTVLNSLDQIAKNREDSYTKLTTAAILGQLMLLFVVYSLIFGAVISPIFTAYAQTLNKIASEAGSTDN